jgi:hypothetical protein
MVTRRDALLSTLFGTGLIGLRSLATGLPAALLLNPRRALAEVPPDACLARAKAQYVIFATSANGDPINTNVPGTYEDPKIAHSVDPRMAATALTLRGASHKAAAPWATLPQAVLDRTVFWHLMTDTPVHPKEPDVLTLMGSVARGEMYPSLLAKRLAPCLGTVQTQPISLGGGGPSEGLRFEGAALPLMPASSLKTTLLSPEGPLTNLQPMRDKALNKLFDVYKNGASPAQRAYIDSFVTSQDQVRNIRQDLLNSLSAIKDNSAESQMIAAVALIQMNVSPVIAVHLPFGGDNHNDPDLSRESDETVASVATISALMQQLASAKLQDRVTLVSLNVFGRTLLSSSNNGRNHNPNHQVSLTIGKPFAGGVVGGVGALKADYGALAIDSKTGKGSTTGDIAPTETLGSFGKTTMRAFGVAEDTIEADFRRGKVIAPALA